MLYCTASGFGTTGRLFLPLPIAQMTVADEWDFQAHSVPAKAGKSIYGSAIKSNQITISGILRKQDGSPIDLTSGEQDELKMFDIWSSLRTNLAKINRSNPAEFFFFYDTSGAGTYRKFKKIYAASLTVEMGDDARTTFPYTLALEITEDTTIYTTAPGS